MEPNLVVIGLNHRAANVAERERFWMGGERCKAALEELVRSEGVQEIVILSTCNRTEFILWADDGSSAASSVQRFLASRLDLRISEWKNFYRLLDEAALIHVFRVAAGLDSMAVGESRIRTQIVEAWRRGQELGTTGHFLDTLFQKAVSLANKLRNDAAAGTDLGPTAPCAAVKLAGQILGTLRDRKAVVLGAGEMGWLAAQCLVGLKVERVQVLNRTLERAQQLANSVGGEALSFDDRHEKVAEADVVISATAAEEFVLTRAELGTRIERRNGAPLCLIDIAVPRSIDPGVREIDGVYLYDIDDLDKAVPGVAGEYDQKAALAAEEFVKQEARGYLRQLVAERVVPSIVAMRNRLDELCAQELREFGQEAGPFCEQEERILQQLTERITRRIANLLAREMKNPMNNSLEELQQEAVTAAVQKLLDNQVQITAARR